ncbi:MAG: flippase, partial [Haloarculaceae archaeon]
MSIAERLARGVKATLVGQAVFIVSNGLLMVVLTRYLLSTAEYGMLNLALSVLGVLAVFSTLGLPKATARYVTEFVESDPGQVPHLLRRTLAYLLALVAVASVALVALSGPIAGLVGEPALAPLLVAGVGYLCAQGLFQYLTLVFQGLNRVTWSAVMRGVMALSRFGLAVALTVAGMGALGALLGYVAGFLLAAGLGLGVLYTRFYTTFDPADSAVEDLSRRVLSYSVPLTATRSANILDKKVDVILVGVLLNPTAVGYYALAKQISTFVSTPATSLGFTISPAIGQQKEGDALAAASRIYQESLEHVLLLYVPATVGLALVAKPTVRYVFSASYLPAVTAVQVFCGFILVDAITQITSDGLDYLGRARSRAIAKGATSVANAALNLLLIPAIGVVGAAVATVITYSTYTAVNLYVIDDELALDRRRLGRRLLHIAGVTAAMAVCVVALLPMVSGLPSL